MTLNSLNPKLSELQAQTKHIFDRSILSNNGLIYLDPEPIFYCLPFEIIITPTMDRCKHCHEGREVLEITEENRTMYLDKAGNVNEVNRGKDDPVTACLIMATVKECEKTEKRIVYRKFEGIKRCPKEL